MTEGVTADERDSWFLILPVAQTPRRLLRAPGTSGVIAASLLVVAIGDLWPSVTRALQSSKTALADGELWRLVTYGLPHGGWVHVGLNMALLALFGWQLERRVGTPRFLAIYFGCGAMGMALLSAFNPIDHAHGLQVGASLAVFGTVAATAVWHVVDGGWRGAAWPWAAGTCLFLLIAGGVLDLGGHEGVIDSGLDGFLYGSLNHALGVVAGVVLGAAFVVDRPAVQRVAAALALVGSSGALVIGIGRWT